MIFAGRPENDKVKQGGPHRKPSVNVSLNKVYKQQDPINNAKHLYFNRDDKHQIHLYFRECSGKREENRHIDIICAEIPPVCLCVLGFFYDRNPHFVLGVLWVRI